MISLLLLAGHMLGDFVFQTDWMAKHKLPHWRKTDPIRDGEKSMWVSFGGGSLRPWYSPVCLYARTLHVSLYVLTFVPVVLLLPHYRLPLPRALAFLALLFVTHWVTDCRRWASGEKWPPKPVLVDQAIHAGQLAVLGCLFWG